MNKFFHTIVWLFRLFIHSYQLAYFNKLNKLSSKRKNDSLCILGNGKSLNDELDSMYDGKTDFMVVNRHILSDSYQIVKPKYYVLADLLFFQSEKGYEVLEKIKLETSWEMYLFVPSWIKVFRKVKKQFSNSKNVIVVPYNAMSFQGYNCFKQFLYKYNLSCPPVTNVLVGAIYISICLKYKKIRLYGVEHNWTRYISVNNLNEVCIEDALFFDKNEVKLRTWLEYTGKSERLSDILKDYAGMFESYYELNKMAEKEKVEILNCTKNSFIDAFNRI